jgi:hypothetical protein
MRHLVLGDTTSYNKFQTAMAGVEFDTACLSQNVRKCVGKGGVGVRDCCEHLC